MGDAEPGGPKSLSSVFKEQKSILVFFFLYLDPDDYLWHVLHSLLSKDRGL